MNHPKKTKTANGALHGEVGRSLQHFMDFKKSYDIDEIVDDDDDDENDVDYEQKSSSSMEEDYESDAEKKKTEEEESDDGSESEEDSAEAEESVNFKNISHVYVSVVPNRDGSLVCYGFDAGSTPYGIQIVREINNSLHCDEYDTYYNEKHVLLINRIIEMAFYDSEDCDRYSREENGEWRVLSERLFGKALTSNDVGEWEKLHEQEIPECGFVVTTIVKCDDM